jgi:hypothetical protein
MARYIVRYVGEGLRPTADMRRIRSAPGLTVLDASSRMMLVETTAGSLKSLMSAMPGWTCTPERKIRLPDPRPRPRRRPSSAN